MRSFALCVAAVVLSVACQGGGVDQPRKKLPSIQDVPAARWERLRGAKIFFGHQSVGDNIVEGLRDLVRANPQIGVAIADLPTPPRLTVAGFAQAHIGENGDAPGKTDAFARLVDDGLDADIAFHKYCFADFTSGTNPRAVFDHYRAVMSRLAAAHPEVTFIHVTVPLTRPKLGPRDLLNKLLGRRPGEYEGNILRGEFNDLLRAEYTGRGPLFDLAAIESTHADGTREMISSQGRQFESLAPEYTSDGGHLNETGRRLAAEQLLILLAEASASRAAGAPSQTR